MARQIRSGLGSRILWMSALAAGLAYTEASVVVYLREVLAPKREELFPQAVREALPLLSARQLQSMAGNVPSFWLLEMAREVTPLIVLVAAAVGFRRRRGEAVGFFLTGFAVWDMLYYAALKLLMDWPASLATWDVLYLIPVPWVAPVWAPLAVSATLLVAGLLLLARPRRGMSARAKVGSGVLLAAGAGLILASFLLRLDEAVGGVPAAFDWPWFLAGWVLGSAGLAWVVTRPSAVRP